MIKHYNRALIIIGISSIVITICIIAMKIMYYIDKINSRYFSNILIEIVWICTSTIISTLPMIINAINCLVAIIRKSVINTILSISASLFLVSNIVLEIISILGGAMSLDKAWSNMAFTMLDMHIISFCIIICTIIAICKKNKNSL